MSPDEGVTHRWRAARHAVGASTRRVAGVRAPDALDRLEAACAGAVELLDVTGAAVTLVSRPTEADATLTTCCATDVALERFEDLQHAAGQGPSLDAARFGRPVHAPVLATQGPRWWPWLGPPGDPSVAAVFSFPLPLPGTAGTFDVYRDRCGELTATQTADARRLVASVLREVVALQARSSAAALALRAGALSSERTVIEQATGMVAVQLAASVSDALGYLRAYARAHRRQPTEVAREVLSGALRLG